MNRRDLVAGLAAAGATSGSPPPESGTLYIPPAHRVEDLAALHELMDRFPFAELVTTAPSLRISHIPVWLDPKAGDYGTLYGHVARNNPQTAAIEAQGAAVVVFRGPHAYISPSWYENKKAVPTWNFAAVHAAGTFEPVTDERELHHLLSVLVAKSEGTYAAGEYDFNKLPPDYVSNMMKGIAGFKMRIDSLEGKFKLGQERSQGDRDSILAHLKSAKPESSIAELTAAWYRRTVKDPDRAR